MWGDKNQFLPVQPGLSVSSLLSVGDWKGVLLWLFASLLLLCPFSFTPSTWHIPHSVKTTAPSDWIAKHSSFTSLYACGHATHQKKLGSCWASVQMFGLGPYFHLFVPEGTGGLDLSEPVSRNVSPWFERDPLLSWFFIRDLVAICGFTFGNSFLCKEKKLPAGRQQSVFSLGSNYFHTLGWGSLWHLKQEIEYWVTHVLHPNFW